VPAKAEAAASKKAKAAERPAKSGKPAPADKTAKPQKDAGARKAEKPEPAEKGGVISSFLKKLIPGSDTARKK
jgi:hypothetical protein